MHKVDSPISPKQAALALGVSESSLKRWCDQGKIRAVKTPGGHRRIQPSAILEFVRSSQQELANREVLGLPPSGTNGLVSLDDSTELMANALLEGDELRVHQIFFDLYLNNFELHTIFDKVIAGGFQKIGQLWECEDAEIYQERRSCEISLRLFHSLRQYIPSPSSSLVAFGGTLPGDNYSLPTAMIELVLRNHKIKATSFGNSIPGLSFARAIKKTQPAIVWISVSYIQELDSFIREFNIVADCCFENNTALVTGGNSLTPQLRKEIRYTTYCDTMEHLHTFIRTTFSSSQQTDLVDRTFE